MVLFGSIHTALAADGAAPDWVQLLPAGTFSGRDGRGPYRVADAGALIEASMASGAKLPIDENHAIDLATPVGQPSPARGWIVELEARQGAIWGRVEWTPTGKQLMSEKAYRGISPVFTHAKDGTVSRMLRAALTNNPNLDLASLHAALTSDERDKMAPEMFAVPETKQLPLRDPRHVELAWDMVDRTEGLSAAQRKEARRRILHRASELGIDTKGWDTAAKHAADPGEGMNLAAIRAALKLPETADEAAIVAAIGGLNTSIATHSQQAAGAAALEQKVVALQTELTTLQTGVAQDKAIAFVDAAIKAGKPINALRDHYIARHQREADAVEKEINAMVSINAGGMAAGTIGQRAAGGGDEPTAAELETATRMSLDPKELVKIRKAREAKGSVA